ncbi:MAG: response regulator transcription factor, partial [Armatimonadota bacterium]
SGPINDDDVIKKIPQLKSIGCKVIAFTQKYNKQILDKFFSSGGIGYVSKTDPVINLQYAIKNAENEKEYISSMFREKLENNTDISDLLSPKEKQVMLLIARGLTNTQIAEELFISKKTADTHRYRIYKKLNIHSRKGIVDFVIKNCMLDEYDHILN